MNDFEIAALLRRARTIAVVGHSADRTRTSYQIAAFLRRTGYTVHPVNPTVDEIDGRPSYPTLADVPAQIDIISVFRRSEHLPEIVRDAAKAGAGAVWAQLGIEHPEAAEIAREAGIPLMMNRCIKVELMRLGIEQVE